MSDPNQPPNQPPGPSSGQPEQPPNPYGVTPPYGAPVYGQPVYGQPVPPGPGGPPGYGAPGYGAPGYGMAQQKDPDKRPGTITAAGIITLVLSGLTLLLFAALAIALIVARDDVVDELRGESGLEDFNPDDLVTFLTIAVLVLVFWCLATMVIAVFAMRRSNVARILLVISSSMAALISLLGITSILSAITLIGAVAVIVLLFVGDAGDWYARRGPQPQLPVGTTQPWG